jgi:hypothetical protein
MPENYERNSKRLEYLKKGLKKTPEDYQETEEMEEVGGYRITVVHNKQQKNSKNFQFNVMDINGKTHMIKRNLTDMIWLRNNLRKDFPYSYVSGIVIIRSPLWNQWIIEKPLFRIISINWPRCLI